MYAIKHLENLEFVHSHKYLEKKMENNKDVLNYD